GARSDLSASEALAFANVATGDFEGIFWIDCAHRSRAGILGDISQSLGLRLSGTLDRNRVALEDFCDERRCLFIFENLAPEHRDCLDEAQEVLEILLNSAEGHADFQTIHRLKWERSWILEHWNQPVALETISQQEPTQLSLF